MAYYIVETTRRPDGAHAVKLVEPTYPEFKGDEKNYCWVEIDAERTLFIQEHTDCYQLQAQVVCHYRACLRTGESWGKEFDGTGDRKSAWRRFLAMTNGGLR